MRKFYYLLLLITCCNSISAQQNHFIYLQAESRQPFYVKLDKKLYSSSVSGYLIIPKLQDGTYSIAVGFPKGEWPEQNITCKVDHKDAGYLLKNFGDKGWGLFNLQTLGVVMAVPQNTTVVTKETKTDAFSNMLADAVNDPSIKQKEPVKEEPKPVPVKEEKKQEPVVEKEIPKKQDTTEPVETKQEPVVVKSAIVRSLYNKNAEGVEMIYIDTDASGKKDTISVFIPADKKVTEDQPVENKSKPDTTAKVVVKEDPVVQQEKPKEKFIDIELPAPNRKAESQANTATTKDTKEVKKDTPVAEKPKEVQQPVSTATAMINSNCKATASEDDFLKLRKKMAAEENDDDMINVAKKNFKSKCFTTEQLKNLSVLFLKDEGRYKFFDEAYAFVTDSANFPSLESQFTDPYYLNRFKVMIRH